TKCNSLQERFANVQKSMKLYRFQSRRLKRLLKEAHGQALDAADDYIFLNDEDDVHMAERMIRFEEPVQAESVSAALEPPAIAPAAIQPTTPTKLEERLHYSYKSRGSKSTAISAPCSWGIRDTFVEVFGSRICGQASIAAPSKSVFVKLLEAAAGQPSYR
ncbi:hypothetical protein VaNZ11_016984, partial [Volvox africanus]